MSLESPQLTSAHVSDPHPTVSVADATSDDNAIIVPQSSSTEKENNPHDRKETVSLLKRQPLDDSSFSATSKTLSDDVASNTKSSNTPNKGHVLSEQTSPDKHVSKHEGGLGVGAFPWDSTDVIDKRDYGTPRSLSSFEARVQQKYADDAAGKKAYGTPRSLSSFEAQVQQKYHDEGIRPPAHNASASMGTPGQQAGALDINDIPRSTSMPAPAATGQYRLHSSGEKGSPDSTSPVFGEEVVAAGEPVGPGAFSVQGRAIGGAPAWARGRRRRNSSARRNRRRSRRSSTEGSGGRSGSRRFSFQSLLSFASSTATDLSHIPPELRVSDQSNIPPELRVSNNSAGEPVTSSTTSVSARQSDIEAVCHRVGKTSNKTNEQQKTKGDTKIKRPVWISMALLIVIVAVVVIILVVKTKNKKAGGEAPLDSPDDDFVDPRKAALQASFEYLTTDMSVFDDPLSAQSLALEWLAERDDIAVDETNKLRLETRYVLAVLYYATKGEEWLDRNSFLTSIHECNWTSLPGLIAGGISCDDSLKVTNLDLGHNHLLGYVPHEIQVLSNLEQLHLRNNSLTGELPDALTKLTKLTVLDMSENNLASAIPFNIGRLTNLSILLLGRNGFTGTIPQAISLLHELEELDFSRTLLSGPILGAPPGAPWVDLTRLETLDLSYCQFTGTIPTHVSSLSSLVDLRVDGNLLTGPIPLEQMMSSLMNLTSLTLSLNELSGTLPSNFDHALSLRTLDLSFNYIESSIPETIGKFLPSLQFLGLARNYITGTLPTSLGEMTGLQHIKLQQNNIEGTLPLQLANCSGLSGVVFAGNGLVGEIPSVFGDLSALEHLDLTSNGLEGTLPSELGRLQKLSALQLENNLLSGSVPQTYVNMSSLAFLSLRANDLEGDVGFLCPVVGDKNKGQIFLTRVGDLVCMESCCESS